jgi:hypothetical protein
MSEMPNQAPDIWENLFKINPSQNEKIIRLKNNPDIDKNIKLILARLTALGIETSGSCAGHLDQSGQLIKQPFVTWISNTKEAEPIINELKNSGTNILISEEMLFTDDISSHPFLDVHPFKSGITWHAVGLFEDPFNHEDPTRLDEFLPGLWFNIQAILNRFDKLGIQSFKPEDFVEFPNSSYTKK